MDVAPLVQSFTAVAPDRLIELCPSQEVDLLRLGQLLAARFFNECLQLQRAFGDLRVSLAAANEQLSSEGELGRLKQHCEDLERQLQDRQVSLAPPTPRGALAPLAPPTPREACANCCEAQRRLQRCEAELAELQ
ncbi:unnamed protein product, partial [Effrenium voratum]